MRDFIVYYDWHMTKPLFEAKDCEFRVSAPDPIGAIAHLHRRLQTTKDLLPDRRTLKRPALRPAQYTVKKLVQVYRDATRQLVYSEIDYPKSPNPDVLYDHGRGLDKGAKAGKDDAEFDLGSAPGVVKPANHETKGE